jgi:integrase
MKRSGGELIVMDPPAVEGPQRKGKSIPPTQAALNTLPFRSGCWSVQGVTALYVRCRAKSKVFFTQRRVRGKLIQKTLGALTMAEAKRRVAQVWRDLKPVPEETRKLTLRAAWERYVEEKDLSKRTKELYQHSLRCYLGEIADRPLRELGEDRAGVRRLLLNVKKTRGPGIAFVLSNRLSAVFRYWRRVDPTLPEPPTNAVDLAAPKPRDAALRPEALRDLWARIQKLPPALRVAWQLLIFTGGRKGSIMALRWSDVDLDAGIVFFAEAKGGRSYRVPLCRRMVAVLREWKEQCPPSERGWLFPSPVRPGEHIVGLVVRKHGVTFPHAARHTFRTALSIVGAPYDASRLLLGHALAGPSGGYVSKDLVVESLREWAEKVAAHYESILGLEPLP